MQDITNAVLARSLERLAPPRLAEDYDNVGLLVGEAATPVKAVRIALDITPGVLEEAVDAGANLVISHHPIWFRSRRHLRGDDFVSRQILFAVRHGLSLYACHTNLDNIRSGVNRTIVDRLGLIDADFLVSKPGETPSPGASFCEAGSGMIGRLPEPLAGDTALLELLRGAFDCRGIRYAPRANPAAAIETVAVCGGAGSFLLDAAMRRKADAFVTADVTYHKFFDSMGQLLFCDIGHFESEQFTGEILRDYLRQEFPALPVELTSLSTNPVRYFS